MRNVVSGVPAIVIEAPASILIGLLKTWEKSKVSPESAAFLAAASTPVPNSSFHSSIVLSVGAENEPLARSSALSISGNGSAKNVTPPRKPVSMSGVGASGMPAGRDRDI